MSKINESAFEADVSQVEDRQAALRRELAELENAGPARQVQDAPEAEFIDDEDVEIQGERKTIFSDVLDREITFVRPNSVDVAVFQSDVASQVLSDVDRMAAMGDFVREYVDAEDFNDWRRACRRKGSGPFFYESMAALLELLIENAVEDSDSEWDETRNRVKRRAALKAKQNREKAKSGGK